ncbi:MAG TPA: transposase, partial [Amycolatopsis sp.]
MTPATGTPPEFRRGLTERELVYVLQVDPTATAHPGEAVPATALSTGRGRPPKPRYPDEPVPLRELALSAGRAACRRVTWRNGTRKTKD